MKASELHPTVLENAVRQAWKAGATNNSVWDCPCCMFKSLAKNSDLIRNHIERDACGVLTDSVFIVTEDHA